MTSKRFRSIVALILSFIMLMGIAAACGQTQSKEPSAPVSGGASGTPKPPLVIPIIQSYDDRNTQLPKDDQLKNYASEQLNKYVGREVIFEWVTSPVDRTSPTAGLQEIQMWHNSKTGPWMYNNWALHWNDLDAMDYVRNTGWLRTFTADELRKLAPTYARRLDELNYPIEGIVNTCAEMDVSGKMYGIPHGFDCAMFERYRSAGFANGNLMLSPSANYYQVYLRDDILKTLYPDAYTEQELRDKLISQGYLTIEDFTGVVNFSDPDAVYDYLVKVKELAPQNNGKTMIPGQLCHRSEGTGTIDNSMRSLIGFQWRWPVCFASSENNLQDTFEFRTSSHYEELFKWFNKCMKEGLMDPELFVMKDDQMGAKAISGDYAVVNTWVVGFYTAAKAAAADTGADYGWVPMPLGYPYDFKNFNNSFSPAPSVGKGGRAHFTMNIPAADFEDVMMVFDYHMTEINDDIMTWGHPDWYTGDRNDRKYKAGFEELVAWSVYGSASGGKDGAYYGINAGLPNLYGEGANWHKAFAPFGFFGGVKFPYAPWNVYMKSGKDYLENVDLLAYMNEMFIKDSASKSRFFATDGWSDGQWDGGPVWDPYNAKLTEYGDLTPYAVAAIHAKNDAEFKENWDKFTDPKWESGLADAVKYSADMIVDLWKNVISKQELK